MALFMDAHEGLHLPAEAVDGLAQGAREHSYDEFGVRQVELYHNDEQGLAYCLLEGPDEQAIRDHHAALGVEVGAINEVKTLL